MTSVLASFFAEHGAILPVLWPAATAILLLWIGDGQGSTEADGAARRRWSRAVSAASALVGVVIAVQLLAQAATGTITVYRLGDWPAPFGIVLVIDRLAAWMLLLSAGVAVPVVWAACQGWDARGRHFHALFQFQLMGLGGAFVTGDLFNLFVFFEVLLIASYVLMTHGLGRPRLRAGLHYVVLNLLASALFLVGASLVYAQTGTLNLADLARRVPQVAGADAVLLHAGAMLLLVVFGFKAALVPLAVWLPATYVAACPPVAALFAIMTKVGVYAILRVHAGVFDAELLQAALAWAAGATCLLGAFGALAAATLQRMVAWLTVASVGTMTLAVALWDAPGWAAALYYLPHSTLIVAALFLLADLLARQRPDVGGSLDTSSLPPPSAWLGGLWLLAAASAAGLPPLPGFVGKLMLLQASSAWPVASGAAAVAVWSVVLAAGFMALLTLARAGSVVFWAARPMPGSVASSAGQSGSSGGPGAWGPVVLLLAANIALTAWAAPAQHYARAAADQLHDRAAYARAVLGDPVEPTLRPYGRARETAR